MRVRCDHCADEKLVAFSCKGRGVCPSCTSRRMANTAAHLVDRVLRQVPYRQWVMSFPKRVRFQLARDAALCSRVLRLCLGKVFAWQRRRARALGIPDAECGAVTFCQRFGSLLNLNCHFHTLVPDGVFAETDGAVSFVPVPAPTAEEVETLVAQIARATEKCLACHAQREDEPDLLAHEQARGVEPRQLGATAVIQGTSRRRGRAAFLAGYSLHAERFVSAEDRAGLERLCRYGARAPIANSRLSLNDAGQAVLELKRPYFDGRTRLVLEPVELLRRLATLIPPPWKNLTRYHGVFAPNHRWRSAVVPAAALAPVPTNMGTSDAAPSNNPTRIRWADLLRRVFAIDVLRCDRCSQPMRIIAAITDPAVADLILDHLDRRGVDAPAAGATGPPPAV